MRNDDLKQWIKVGRPSMVGSQDEAERSTRAWRFNLAFQFLA